MKILYLLPALSSGGVEQVVLELCEGLTPRGVECVVASAGGRMVPLIEQTGAKHFTCRLEKKSLRLIPEVFRLARLIREQKPDIVHIHSRIPGWVAHFAFKLLPKQQRPILVSTFHGFYSVNAYSAIMTKAQRIIAVSHCIHDHILQKYPHVPAERVCTIPNTIDISEHNPSFRPTEEWLATWRHEHPELDGKFVLCLPGRITRGKGVHHLIPILSRLRKMGVPAHVLLAGETKKGKEALRTELMRGFEHEGLSRDVTWLGLRRDVREIFFVSDVILSLSIQPEAGPKVTLEALALGRPVAGYAHGGVGEELEIFLPEGMVPVGDTEAMAEKLADWYRHPPELKHPVGAPYTREDMIDAHLNLYRSL